jgi:hypothetical protein
MKAILRSLREIRCLKPRFLLGPKCVVFVGRNTFSGAARRNPRIDTCWSNIGQFGTFGKFQNIDFVDTVNPLSLNLPVIHGEF